MIMAIYKYVLELTRTQRIRIPSPQKFLAVQMQGSKPCVWYEVAQHPLTYDAIDFIIVGTGHNAPDNAQYLGTVQDNEFVWHVYARCEHG
jgi:hypothetical protein